MSVLSVFNGVIYLETARPLYPLAVISVFSVSRETRVSKKNINRKTFFSVSREDIYFLVNLPKNTQDTRGPRDTIDFKRVFHIRHGGTLVTPKTTTEHPSSSVMTLTGN